MSERVRGLQRLADLYGMVERLRSVDLKVAADSVTEATQAIDRERVVKQVQQSQGRVAIECGDAPERVLAESQIELAETRAVRVEQLRRAREVQRETALDAYRASRLRMEQMQHMVRSVREREAMDEKRRFQAALDDRHLSRKLWVEMEARKPGPPPLPYFAKSSKIRT
jgi:hypothetical protein